MQALWMELPFTRWSLPCPLLGSSGTVPCRGLGGAHLGEVSVPGMEDCGPEPSIERHLRKERPVSRLPEVEGDLWSSVRESVSCALRVH